MCIFAENNAFHPDGDSFLHYEKLANDPRSSIRIVNGMVERLLFTETEDGVEVELIEIDSTHYGNKK